LKSDILKTIFSLNYIKNIIIQNYNLMNINNIFLIKSGINDIYKIVSKENQYIFKIYHYTKEINDLEIKVKFIHYLQSNNILVSYPFKTINNQYIISVNYPEGMRFAILTNFIKGSELTYKSDYDAYLYGRDIAKLHIVSKDFSLISKNKKYDIHQILINSQTIIENFLSKNYPNHLLFFSKFSRKLLRKLNNLNLTQQYCHNDLHGGNVKINKKNISFFDFDFCGYGYIIYELAVFKWSCMIGNRPTNWEQFIKGYESILKINTMELKYILYFVAIRDIIIMSMYINRINIIGHEIISDTYIEKRIIFLKYINKKLEGEE